MTWAIVLCRFRDVPQETASSDFFRSYFTRAGTGTEGAFDYWNDISGGRFVNDSEVFGWFEIPHDSGEIANGLHRSVYQQWGFDAAQANGVPLDQYTRRVFFFNANGDHGAAGGGTTVFSYAPGRPLEPTFIFHEMGHTLGLSHSLSDSESGCCGSGTPGEYCDQWDIMSAMCVFKFRSAHGEAGPGLSAPYMDQLGWLDSSRVFRTWNTGSTFTEVDLAPINEPQRQGFLAVRVDLYHDYTVERDPNAPSGPPTSYYVEFRFPSNWDRGIPYPAVLIHRLENGRSTILGDRRLNRPNLDWKVGETFVNRSWVGAFSVSVVDINFADQRARIRITKHGFNPVWMLSGRIEGPGMHWSRGNDVTVAAEVDGDGREEFLIANNQNGYIGVLKWNGSALAPIWIGSGRIQGPGMHWSRGNDVIVAADVDGDGRKEFLIANNQNGYIGVLKWDGTGLAPVWIVAGRIGGNGMHWSRGPSDWFVAADVDGDQQVEILVANSPAARNNWIGVLKWNDAALTAAWVQPVDSLAGPAFRGSSVFIAADLDQDNRQSILVPNVNGWTGMFKWNGTAMAQGWYTHSPLQGSAGDWHRDATDLFVAADVDGDGNTEFLVANNQNGWIGVLKWDPVP